MSVPSGKSHTSQDASASSKISMDYESDIKMVDLLSCVWQAEESNAEDQINLDVA